MILMRKGRSHFEAGPLLDLEVSFDRVLIHGNRRSERNAPWRPPLEVVESAHGLVVRVEIGGLTRDDFQVTVVGQILMISGERTPTKTTDGHRVYHESRMLHGRFEAVIPLPFPADVDSATADYIDGILTVRLPRLAATRVPANGDSQSDETQRGGL